MREALRERIVGIETVDKMTDRQITASVRRHFLNTGRKPGGALPAPGWRLTRSR